MPNLTRAEVSFLRAQGLDAASPMAAELVLGRALTQSHVTTLLVQREGAYFSRMANGERIYASLREGMRVEAGWVRKLDANTAVFNDGSQDLIMTMRDSRGLTHYSVRNASREALAQTRVLDGGRRFEYWTWSADRSRYVFTGYGVTTTDTAIQVFAPDHRLAGTLYTGGLARKNASDLPRSTVLTPVAFMAAAVIGMSAHYEAASQAGRGPMDCEQSPSMWSNSKVITAEMLECRRITQALLAEDGERFTFDVLPVGGAPPERTPPPREQDHPFFYVRPRY